MIIYKITNQINGKIYIDKTESSIEKRLKGHHESAKRGSKYYFHCAIRKYGIENFIIEEIDSAEDSTRLLQLEQFYIKRENSIDPQVGYNMTLGGLGTAGYKHTEETKKKLSEAKIGEKNHMFGKTGEAHHNYGKELSDETKMKLSAALSGENNKLYGIPRSEKDKQAIREGWAQSDYERTEEHINNWRESRKDWSQTEETKKQISETLTGFKRPTDTCPKCGATGSASHLKRFHYDNCGKKRSYGAQAQATCPHCGKTGGASNIKRFHFDRCKMKTI